MAGRRGRGRGGSWIQLLILRIIYEMPLHGYLLLEKMNELLAGRRPIKPGSLYTILRRMEKSGLLSSDWDRESSRLKRRVYKLTEAGLERLKNGRRMVMGQRKVLDEMMNFYEKHFQESESDDEN
jgi:DNA-binding PadR family transcriptional regulator